VLDEATTHLPAQVDYQRWERGLHSLREDDGPEEQPAGRRDRSHRFLVNCRSVGQAVFSPPPGR
jgi:hypothetical protein